MADDEKRSSARRSETPSSPQEAGATEVQERVDRIEEKGLVGTEVDPTPNEAYTVKGVTSGAPTPETNAEAAAKAREASGRR